MPGKPKNTVGAPNTAAAIRETFDRTGPGMDWTCDMTNKLARLEP